MGTEEDNSAATPPPLHDAAVHIGARAIGALGTRIELAGLELAATRERAVQSLLLVGAALACGMLALAVVTLGVIAYFWDGARFTAIALVALAYAVAAVALWLRHSSLRRRAPQPFQATLDALRRDVACLTGEER
ncbi:MAG TPA: phage holin family protein [Casimicrobiaceae bacterium]